MMGHGFAGVSLRNEGQDEDGRTTGVAAPLPSADVSHGLISL